MQNYVGVQTPENIHKIEHNVEDVNTHVFAITINKLVIY